MDFRQIPDRVKEVYNQIPENERQNLVKAVQDVAEQMDVYALTTKQLALYIAACLAIGIVLALLIIGCIFCFKSGNNSDLSEKEEKRSKKAKKVDITRPTSLYD